MQLSEPGALLSGKIEKNIVYLINYFSHLYRQVLCNILLKSSVCRNIVGDPSISKA